MTKGTFGEYLKREREMRGVTLDEITAATRIATRFLQAIEDEHWDQLPGGVFNRGFVRAVARYLGLDEENTVAEYVSAAEDHRPAVPVWIGSPPAVTPEQPWLAWILIAVIVLVLVMGGWFAVRRIFAWRASRHSAQVSAQFAVPPSERSASASTTVPVPFLAPIGPPGHEGHATLTRESLNGTAVGGN
jgi:cytoskeletal protein RodZ